MKKLICLLLLLATLGCSTSVFGPVGVAAVNAVVYWKEGEAHAYYNYDAEIMHKATLRALTKLKLPVTEDVVVPPTKQRRNTIPGYRLVATSNDRFKIKFFSAEKDITRVSIRVNFTGDKNYAMLIYREIEDQLNVVEFKKK